MLQKQGFFSTLFLYRTQVTYDDGAVLGSFILVLSPEGKILFTHLIQDSKGQTLAIKVEGITWLESTSDGEVFLLVTDSDGGDSEVFKILLSNSVFANSSG